MFVDVIGEINAALNDVGYSMPGQKWTYWNKGPGLAGMAHHRGARLVNHDRQSVRVQPPRTRPRTAGFVDSAAA